MNIFRIIPDKIGVVQDQNRPDDPHSWQYKLYVIMFQGNTPMGRLFDVILSLVILVNIVFLLLESVQEVSFKYAYVFAWFDYFFLIVFGIEYILRLLCVKSPKQFIFSSYGIIDLLAILPFFLEFVFPQMHVLMMIRSFRFLRIFRIFKMVKFLDESRLLIFSLIRSFRKITIFLFFVLVLTFFLGSLMYVIEFKYNPGFSSIPQSIYWSIVTITTVGYGDVAPVTALGKSLASFMMILGYAIIAVPTGIFSATMIKETNSKKMKEAACPHCQARSHPAEAKYCWNCGKELET
ncbi:MAG: ion transporter [Chitinophagaceae bacterium]|nr:ion transporter [Chitinophagaceae bacterium]